MGFCTSSDNIKSNRGCIEVECDPEITKLSQLQNDVGYINESYLDNYYNKTDTENKFQEKGNYALKEDVPFKVSQLENDSKFIDKFISDLENYYLKSEIYNRQEILNLIQDRGSLRFKIVKEKPEFGDPSIIYLILNGNSGNNIYDEWIFINEKWELISSQADLSNYYDKNYIDTHFIDIEVDPTVPAWAKESTKPKYNASEVGAIATGSLSTINGKSIELGGDLEIKTEITIDTELSETSTNPVENKVIKQELNKALADKVDKVDGKQLSTEDYTTTEKNKLAGLENYTLTKQKVENVLTGDISTHNHAGQLAIALADYVKKVSGKDLSSNDFTNELKLKLEGLSNYNDEAVQQAITDLNNRLDTLVGTSASEAIDTFNEIEAFLQGITDKQTLTGILYSLKQEMLVLLSDKLDISEYLEDKKSFATKVELQDTVGNINLILDKINGGEA